jgi:hypothetical protein
MHPARQWSYRCARHCDKRAETQLAQVEGAGSLELDESQLRSCEPNRVCPTSEVLETTFQDPVGARTGLPPHVASDLTVVQDAKAISVEKPVARSLFKDSTIQS